MKRLPALAMIFVSPIVLATASSAPAAVPSITRCVATTLEESGRGTADFTGSCNGSGTNLKATPASVTGRVGGLVTNLKRNGSIYTGRIGARKTSFGILGSVVTGRYGSSRLSFAVAGNTLAGRVGSKRVTCSITTVSPLGERVACSGSAGDAEVPIPFLALFYAAP